MHELLTFHEGTFPSIYLGVAESEATMLTTYAFVKYRNMWESELVLLCLSFQNFVFDRGFTLTPFFSFSLAGKWGFR